MNIFRKQEISKPNMAHVLFGLLLIASPWILLFFTTTVISHHSVFDSVPCWSDELSYWHEVLSFSQKGFGSGYYTINETTPAYLSFGSHGFGTVSVYALFAKLFGWKAYSLVLANACFLSLSYLFLVLFVKPTTKQTLSLLLFSLTFTPLLLFSSTSMSELLNYAILIVYFSLLFGYFKRGGRNLLAALFLFCFFISFIRIIYIVLFLPLLFKRKNAFQFDARFVISLIGWIILSGILFLFNGMFVAPYPDSYLNELFSCRGFGDFIANFAAHFIQNTLNFINPFSDNLIQVLGRYFVLFVLIISLFKSNVLQFRQKRIRIEYFVVFLILLLVVLVNIAVYDVFDWRDYRVLSPVLFGSVIFLLLLNDRTVLKTSLIINVITIIVLSLSSQVTNSFQANRYIPIEENKLLNNIVFDSKAHSKFENTLVVQQFDAKTVLNIPAGIGITFCDHITDKLKSKYIYSIKELELSSYQLVECNKSGFLYKKKSEK